MSSSWSLHVSICTDTATDTTGIMAAQDRLLGQQRCGLTFFCVKVASVYSTYRALTYLRPILSGPASTNVLALSEKLTSEPPHISPPKGA